MKGETLSGNKHESQKCKLEAQCHEKEHCVTNRLTGYTMTGQGVDAAKGVHRASDGKRARQHGQVIHLSKLMSARLERGTAGTAFQHDSLAARRTRA